MKHQESTFTGLDNTSLFSQSWLPDVQPRAIVVLVHGVGEHSGRYMNFVSPAISNQFGVYSYDHRGHGNSEGQRGHIKAWSDYRNDLHTFVSMVKKTHPDCPIFLMGHSMGALVTLDYIVSEAQSFAGLILSGTPIEPKSAVSPFLVFLAKALSNIYPRFSLKLGLDAQVISRDPAVVKAYLADPLVHQQASARWGTEILKTVELIKSKASNIHLPVLFVHGEDDQLNGVEGVKQFFNQVPANDKQLLTFEHVRHEPINDTEHKKITGPVIQWLSERCYD